MTARRRLGGVLALALALGTGACSGNAPRPPQPSPSIAAARPAKPVTYPVGLRVLPLRRGPDRPLPTLVFYPAAALPAAFPRTTTPPAGTRPAAAAFPRPAVPPAGSPPATALPAAFPHTGVPQAGTRPAAFPHTGVPQAATRPAATLPALFAHRTAPAAGIQAAFALPVGALPAAGRRENPAGRRENAVGRRENSVGRRTSAVAARGGTADSGRRRGAAHAAWRTLMGQVRRHGTLDHARLGAPPAAGRFPLVVFSHGLSGSPEWCAQALVAWASAGFVVAAPTFPYTSEFTRDYRRADIVHQPDDVRFVLKRIRRLDAAPGDPLRGRIDGERVAAVGHSAGGYTTSGLFTAGHDPRLRAGVIMAGWAAPGAFAGAPATMLFLQGTADPVVPAKVSRAAFRRVPWTKSYVLMPRISHANYLRRHDAGFRRMAATVTAFLRRTLNGDESARACGSRAQWGACFAVPSPSSSR